MARPIWRGHIAFGLVNVPVVLHSAEKRADLQFHLIDSRNSARIRYERVNEETGEEVPWDKIVKGFEYSNNNYVLLSEDELEHASVELTKTIEIEQFVDLADIDVRFFERPYILVPDKKGEKGYVLLREAIAKTGKAGVARVVIRTRQSLAVLMAQDDALVLELLRFEQELRPLTEFEVPSGDLKQYKVTKGEIDLAEKLIGGMSADWDPSEFQDEYRSALMALVERKIESGETEPIEMEEAEAEQVPQTLNFMDVLKKSVADAGKKGKQASSRKSTPRKKTAKKTKKAS
jgi:DNA end-binding protein Ku